MKMNNDNLNYLEVNLKNRFKLYQPNPEFVSNLKHRLTSIPSMELESSKTRPEIYIAAVAAVSGFAVLFWVLRKLLQK